MPEFITPEMTNQGSKTPEKGDGDQALWELLGESREANPSPMFSKNVVREVRQLPGGNTSGASSLWESLLGYFRENSFPRTAFAVSAAATLAILLFSVFFFPGNNSSSPEGNVASAGPNGSTPVQLDPTMELETIEAFGEFVAVSDPATLSDEALMSLFY